jgi:hypothetical protein
LLSTSQIGATSSTLFLTQSLTSAMNDNSDTNTISTTVSDLADAWDTSERRVRHATHEVTGAAVFNGAVEASEDDLRDVYRQLETQTA